MSLENLTPSIQPGTPSRIGKQDKEEILHSVLLGSAFLGLIVYFIKVFITIQIQDWFQTILYSALFLFLILLALLRRLSYSLKLYTFLFILFVMAVSSLYFNGIVSDGFVYLLSFSIILAVFTNIRIGVVGILISVVTIGVFSFAMVNGIFPSPSEDLVSNSRILLDWLSAGFVFLLTEMVAVIAVALTIQRLDRVAREQTIYADELENERATLDQRIQDRTQDLQKKATQLQVASQVARNIALQDYPEEFLSTTVNLIRDQFGFYHSGIFLLDDKREFAFLKAATGEAGKEMLKSEHRLRVGEEGIVGYVVDRGEARIALDVGQDSVHFKNPLLPGTRSEMALPLKIGDKIIGALDVQSELESAFTLEDINILQVIADQLAVALERARLVNDLQSSLQQFRMGVREYTQREWTQYIRNIRGKSAFKYSSTGLSTKVIDSPIMREVTEKGETIIRINENDTRAPAILVVPVKLREQTIGVVEMKITDTSVVETLKNMMETTATRLALALENARLIDEMQTRADQEHMITNIAGKIRTSTAVNDILKMTAVELGKSMGVSEVRVELRTKSQEITDEQYLQEKLP